MRHEGKQVYKVARRCPRCRAERYHFARKLDGQPFITVTCAECGHDWRGKYRKDEWDPA